MKKENLMKLLPTCISGVLLVFLSIVLFLVFSNMFFIKKLC